MKVSNLLQSLFTKFFSSKKARFEVTGLNSAIKLRKLLVKVVELQQKGKLKAIIDRQYPLSRFAQDHSYIDGGNKKGNIIIVNE